jgi:hypothetical protein
MELVPNKDIRRASPCIGKRLESVGLEQKSRKNVLEAISTVAKLSRPATNDFQAG